MSALSRLINQINDKRIVRAVQAAFDKVAGTGAVTALGTSSQSGSAPLRYAVNYVTTSVASTKGVRLPTPETNDPGIWVINTNATYDLLVYPATGGNINGGSANAAYTLPAGQATLFVPSTPGAWFTGIVGATSAQIAYLTGAAAGTAAASKVIVLDTNKATDYLRSTTERDLGGTGVPGAALVVTEFVKEVTAIADATATAILTLTIPNAAHAGMLELAIVGRMGAGGTIGADECVSTSKYQGTFNRTPGVASVLTLSSQLGAVNNAVAGATTVTATLSKTDTGEGVSATNTHVIKVTITKAGGSSANHKCDVFARIFNSNVTGATLA